LPALHLFIHKNNKMQLTNAIAIATIAACVSAKPNTVTSTGTSSGSASVSAESGSAENYNFAGSTVVNVDGIGQINLDGGIGNVNGQYTIDANGNLIASGNGTLYLFGDCRRCERSRDGTRRSRR
jgi:hypothetical protein